MTATSLSVTASANRSDSAVAPTVLFLSHETSRTGAPIFLLRFLRWFGQRGLSPFRVLAASEGALFPELAALAKTDSFEPPLTFSYRLRRKLNLHERDLQPYRARLRDELADANIQLIYSNTFANGALLEFLSFLNCPVLTHVHELDGVIRFLGERNEFLVKKHTSDFIAVSGAVANNLVSHHGISPGRVHVIHGFIPIPEELLDRADARASVRSEFGLPADALLVCSCGSIEPRKGLKEFIEVAKLVTQSRSDVHFLWVGGGGKKLEEARKSAQSQSISERVHFPGARPDVAKYYAASDVFLLSSLEDPFPLVVMEAALLGLPVVCFEESGGAPEFVEQDAGLVARGFDVNDMAAKISQLLSSEDIRHRMGQAGRQKVLNRFNLDVGAAKIAQVIHSMVRPIG